MWWASSPWPRARRTTRAQISSHGITLGAKHWDLQSGKQSTRWGSSNIFSSGPGASELTRSFASFCLVVFDEVPPVVGPLLGLCTRDEAGQRKDFAVKAKDGDLPQMHDRPERQVDPHRRAI